MPAVVLRYKNLVERGIVHSRVQLHHFIKKHGFPAGRMLSPNARFWTEDEIDAWLDSRPEGKQPARGWAKKHEANAEVE